jgi:hypothetical protein
MWKNLKFLGVISSFLTCISHANAFEQNWSIRNSTDKSFREIFDLKHLDNNRLCYYKEDSTSCKKKAPETPLILMEVCVTKFSLGAIDGIEILANNSKDVFDNGKPVLRNDTEKCQLVGMRPSMTLEVRFLNGENPQQSHTVEGTYRVVPY